MSIFCKEAGFMRVEVGQHLMTKDIGNLRQCRSVSCREYTLPRDDPASEAKGWIQRNVGDWTCIGSHNQFSTLKIWN